jgi:hypothetical protein
MFEEVYATEDWRITEQPRSGARAEHDADPEPGTPV